MNIGEALKTGKRFKRVDNTGWHEPSCHVYQFHIEDLMATDWEIQTEKMYCEYEEFEQFKEFLKLDNCVVDVLRVANKDSYKLRASYLAHGGIYHWYLELKHDQH